MWAHTCMLFSCQHIHVILDKMSALAPQSDRDAATEPFAWHSGGAQARLRQVWASLLDDGEQRCLPPSICAAFVCFFACAIVDIASIPTHALARTVRLTASIPSAFPQLDLAPLNLDQLSGDDPASSRTEKNTRPHKGAERHAGAMPGPARGSCSAVVQRRRRRLQIAYITRHLAAVGGMLSSYPCPIQPQRAISLSPALTPP